MERRNALTVAAVVVLIILAAIVWSLPDLPGIVQGPEGRVVSGDAWASPWDDMDAGAATASAQAWLGTDAGGKAFPGCSAGDAVPVFDEGGELFMWIIPVKGSDGLYAGYIQADAQAGSEGFTNPSSSFIYTEPARAFIGRETAIDMHTYFILRHGATYAPEHISEPYIIIRQDGGFYWMSEVVENGNAIERFFEEAVF